MGGGDVHLLMTIRIQIYRLDWHTASRIRGILFWCFQVLWRKIEIQFHTKDFVVTTAEIESIKAQVKARYDLSNKSSHIKAPTDKAASKPPSANNQFNNQSTPRPQTGVQMKRKACVSADDGRWDNDRRTRRVHHLVLSNYCSIQHWRHIDGCRSVDSCLAVDGQFI